uniref:Uncharacterized protein n=1 Tax=Meloidogyne hapla TaxID=6305 RepID=A0A1I8BUV1_MELHA
MSCCKKINENSPLALNSALSIFTVPPTNVSVVRSFFREILPLSTITQDSPYLFPIISGPIYPVHISTSSFQLKNLAQIINGVQFLQPIYNIGSIQGIGQTFVQQLKVTVGNNELYDSGTLYLYKAYITNELSFPDNVKSNFLASIGYYKSEKQDEYADTGFQKRCSLFANGKRSPYIKMSCCKKINENSPLALNSALSIFTSSFQLKNLAQIINGVQFLQIKI